MPADVDLVVLVPGFLGFDEFGEFSYFGAVARATLAGELAARLGPNVRIESASTAPAGTLMSRQERLVAQLKEWDRAHLPARIHLIGHSTGALDAELLTRENPLRPRATWAAAGSFRRKVRTVIGCASPAKGTWLAASDLAEFVAALGHEGILHSLLRDGAPTTAWIALTMALAAVDNRIARALAESLFTDPLRSIPFAMSLVRHRELIGELRPSTMSRVYARAGARQLDVNRWSFVTVAPPPASHRATLYANLARALAEATADEAPPVSVSSLAFEDVITSGWTPETLSPVSSDGVVNSLCQLQDGERRVLVVGDHLDVLAHVMDDGHPYGPSGLLESEARFRLPEARALYGRIARAVVESARPSRGRSSPPPRPSTVPPPP